MLFWLICAVLTVAAAVYSLRPVLGDTGQGERDDAADLRVYKDQLTEVDRDVRRGLLSAEEAGAAKIEISRRILALETADAAAPGAAADGQKSAVFYGTAGFIIASTLAVYLVYGSPGYQGLPHAERAKRPPGNAPIAELIARVEARLRETPDDGQGWDVLAPVYLKQGRNQDAARAFARAIALLGENRARLRGLAEAHLAASNGIVGKEVRAAYTKLLAKEPHLIAPRFWLAVGLEQDGKRDEAIAAYRALLDTKNGSPHQRLPAAIKRLVEQRLTVLGGGTGKPVASAPAEQAPAKPPPAVSPEAGKIPAPPPGMAASMAPKDRAAMIEQMVSGLAQRLKEDGGSLQEWQRLIRSYWVLGRREQATTALGKARQQFASDAAKAEQLDAFARQLGMNPG